MAVPIAPRLKAPNATVPLTLPAIEGPGRYLSSQQGRLEFNKQPEFRDTFPVPLKAKENQ